MKIEDRIAGAYPELYTTEKHFVDNIVKKIGEQTEQYIVETCIGLKIDPDVLQKQMLEINRLNAIIELYRWHDLRKNPDDLPAGEGYFDVCVLIKQNDAWGIEERYLYDTQYFCEQFQTKPTSISEVIAWREVELFEPEE